MNIMIETIAKIAKIQDIGSRTYAVPMGTFRTNAYYIRYCKDLGSVGSGFKSRRAIESSIHNQPERSKREDSSNGDAVL